MRKSRLSWGRQCRLMELFVAGATARTAASLVGVNKNTAVYYFHRLRELIMARSEPVGLLAGEVEADESYFGGRRKGKRGRGAAGKVPVFGLLRRGGRVFAVVIADAKGDTLAPIIRAHVRADSVVYTDAHAAYNALDVLGFEHHRVNHSRRFVNDRNHINGIENFWSQAKRHLRRFNGIPREHFALYLKECEWRFNTSDPKEQLRQLKQWVKDDMG